VASIVVVIAVIALDQVRIIQKMCWLPRYVGWYVGGGLVLVVLAFLPGLTSELYHYNVALTPFPDAAFPTRLSAIHQAFLCATLEGDLFGRRRFGRCENTMGQRQTSPGCCSIRTSLVSSDRLRVRPDLPFAVL
jgi:hypothetical protein